jgi:energy-coupling factor transporter transmembrane protein EcfT
MTLLFTVSRNGVLTLMLVGLFLLIAFGSLRGMTKRHVFVGIMIGGLLFIFGAMTFGDFKKRFEAEGYDKEYGGKVYEGRGAYLIQAKGIVEHEPFGCGLNNWSWCVSNRYGPIVQQFYVPYVSTDVPPPRRRLRRHHHIDYPQAAPAHSLYAITLGETGWLGVILFAIVWLRWFAMTGAFLRARSSALDSRFGTGVLGALIGAFCQSFSEWEVRQTPLAFLLHILLGATAGAHLRRRLDARAVRV